MLELTRRQALVELAIASVAVTSLVTVISVTVPKQHSGTGVGLAFLAAVWLLVWRRDDAVVSRMGLALGGLVLSSPIEWRKLLREAGVALAWALAFAVCTFVPFYFGWRVWWKPAGHFALVIRPYDTMNLVLGQTMLVALPEEAFYRGYLQTRLDEVLPPKLSLFGGRVGPGLLIASMVFALGHLLTVHNLARLAVFFPSLLFGWLRARTGGVGASIAFHVACNVFSETLGKGFGVY